jgi:preprotein translocase subunit SecF
MVFFKNDFEEVGMRLGKLYIKSIDYSLFVKIVGVLIYLSFFFVLFFLLNNMLK